MTSSLPKIKHLPNNVQNQNQKNTRFKKVKIYNNLSTQDINKRFKSVKSQRINNLNQSTAIQQKSSGNYNQKIYINILQRKLLAGNYDETNQVQKNLHIIKQNIDFFKLQSSQKLSDINKIKNYIDNIKKQFQLFSKNKFQIQQIINKIKCKCQHQKSKNQTIIYNKISLQYMVKQRQNINAGIEARINQLKQSLTKLKSLHHHTGLQRQQSQTHMKNLSYQSKKLAQQLTLQQKTRQLLMHQKHQYLTRRIQQQRRRDKKLKESRKQKQQQDQQLQNKLVIDVYTRVLVNLFIRRYGSIKYYDLVNYYQGIQNCYYQIASYQKFYDGVPGNMVGRFKQLDGEMKQFEQEIKKLQQKQVGLEKKHLQLLKKYKQCKLMVIKYNGEQNKKVKFNNKDLFNFENKIIQQNIKIDQIINWNIKYLKQFQIKLQPNITIQNIGTNFNNILKCIIQEKNIVNKNNNNTLQGNKENLAHQ